MWFPPLQKRPDSHVTARAQCCNAPKIVVRYEESRKMLPAAWHLDSADSHGTTRNWTLPPHQDRSCTRINDPHSAVSIVPAACGVKQYRHYAISCATDTDECQSW